jgi:hypothetical protein
MGKLSRLVLAGAGQGHIPHSPGQDLAKLRMRRVANE